MAKDEADQAFDDLLWELDVTIVRSAEEPADGEPRAATPPSSPAPAPDPAPARASAPSSTAAARPVRRTKATSKRGEFYRPELQPRWQRTVAHPVLKVTAAVALLAGTGTLVAVALMR